MSHEHEEVVSALAELCKKLEVKCLIQIGAEDGYEADYVRNETGCRAIAIEANPMLSSYSPHLEYHRGTVIGASDKMTNFFLHDNTGLSGHFPRNDGKEKMLWLLQMSLESFCLIGGGIEPDALIIDTEGSTMEVLEGCSKQILDGLKLVYAEVQSKEIRPGIRLVGEVDKLLTSHGMIQYLEQPTYGVGDAQYNMTWIREDSDAETTPQTQT